MFWRKEPIYISKHGAPLRLGRADWEQRRDLFFDFAWFSLLGVILAAPFSGTSFESASAAIGLVGLAMWIGYRSATVAVTLVEDDLLVRNVFRSYRIPLSSITKVVSRRAWWFGKVAFCFGIVTRTPFDAILGRSVPLHALNGGDRQERDLRDLLGLSSTPA